MKPLTILCDVDDVVADLVPTWLQLYNRDWGDILTPEDIKSWQMQDWVSGECGPRIYEYLNRPDLYAMIEPVPGALVGVRTLRLLGHRVVFVTSANATQMGNKLRWLTRHGLLPDQEFAQHDFVAAHDKALIRGDLLIDDRVDNVLAFPGGKVLFDRPWNRSQEMTGIGQRARGWHDMASVLAILEQHQEMEANAA